MQKPQVVYQIKDTIFWKQITTGTWINPFHRLLFIRSKIQFFESKSQLQFFSPFSGLSCLSDQRYNFLKANHNPGIYFHRLWVVVYQIKDTIFWKQITTIPHKYAVEKMLFIRSKIQFFESKSQHEPKKVITDNGCLSDQRYNFLKANHNPTKFGWKHTKVVYQIKDTIFWKQITTKYQWIYKHNPLFIRSKIQFFESKSQQSMKKPLFQISCLSDQRYNFLKANHNSLW